MKRFLLALVAVLALSGNALAIDDCKLTQPSGVGEGSCKFADVTATGTLTVTGAQTFTGNTTLSGTLDVTGTTSLDGAVNLGDAAADVVTLNGRLNETSTFTHSFPCRNETGGAFAAGDLVHIEDWDTTDVPLMVLADADANLQAHAVMAGALADATTGVCYRYAEVTGIDTSAAATEGDDICLTPTATTGNTWAVEASCTAVADEFKQIAGHVTVDAASGAILFDLRYQDMEAVGSGQIQTGAVTTTEILDSTIATADIAANTILQADVSLVFGTGTAPVASSCGTSPTVVGSDMAGKVTIGTSAAAVDGCVLTFNTAFTNAPSCTVTGEDPAIGVAATSSTTALTITTEAAGDTSSDVLMYICLGNDAD